MDLAFWRDVSLFYLLFMQIVVTIAIAVLLYFVVRGVMIARRKATQGVRLARNYVSIGRMQTTRLADRATAPLVRSHGEAARSAAMIAALLPRRQPASSPPKATKE
ncbi:MAG TPA: hypothetical protein GYA08_16785 [Chloroflexi bacterium]|nr:hypothetical protein [Chloroflexota bacterium]